MPEKLSYGDPDTQYGVVTNQLEDGGVEIIVPERGVRGLLGRFFRMAFNSFPHRAVITLSSKELRIIEPGTSESNNDPIEQAWPLTEVGEVRPNRYSRGIYVSIPGQANFDLLTDQSDPMIQYIGNTLNETLKRLRATASA